MNHLHLTEFEADFFSLISNTWEFERLDNICIAKKTENQDPNQDQQSVSFSPREGIWRAWGVFKQKFQEVLKTEECNSDSLQLPSDTEPQAPLINIKLELCAS